MVRWVKANDNLWYNTAESRYSWTWGQLRSTNKERSGLTTRIVTNVDGLLQIQHLYDGKPSIKRRIELLRMKPEQYRKTPEWKNTSKLAREYYGAYCHWNVEHEGILNVHHNTYARQGHELLRDLLVVCRSCHAKYHDVAP